MIWKLREKNIFFRFSENIEKALIKILIELLLTRE